MNLKKFPAWPKSMPWSASKMVVSQVQPILEAKAKLFLNSVKSRVKTMLALDRTFYCIHGFLGQARDWDPVLPSGIRSIRFNLFSPVNPSFPDFGQVAPLNNILVGYSLG